jgi:DNA-binding response OmpR family regulator
MKKKVLVVDDDKGTLVLAKNLLKEEGHEVIILDNPRFAIKKIKNEHPDLVILDILMPYKDGYKLCEEIKEAFHDKIPVIIFTSQPYEKDLIKDAYKDFGADDYLLKPFEPGAFIAKVNQYV